MENSYKTLIVKELEGGTAIVSFNRPDAANALNALMAAEIKAFFDYLAPSCRAVIVTGQGKHFCAGADLKERKNMDETQWQTQHHAFEGACAAIMACAIPVIAAVNGSAFGGGLELALACDFIYAADNATFGLTETTLGIMPGLGGTQTLPRAVGLKCAKELMFTGRAFTASEAFAWGMVNRVCAANALLDETMACVKTISANAPFSIKAIKKAADEGIDLPLSKALQCELKYYATLLNTQDRHEGINAFNEKRKPRFTGA